MNYFLRKSISLGTVSGIEVALDYSWFFLFILVIWSLTAGLFPTIFPQMPLTNLLILAVTTAFLFFVSVLAHEFGHALVAQANGIPVPKITLFLFGGAAELADEPNNAKTEFLMASAGPLVSLCLAIVFGLAWYMIKTDTTLPLPLENIASTLMNLNLTIAFFNLLPGFPLDGGRILRAIVWRVSSNYKLATKVVTVIGQIFAFGVVAVGIGEIIMGNMTNGVWYIFLGLFLNFTAVRCFRQVEMKEVLHDIPVRSLMSREIMPLHPRIMMPDFLSHYLGPFERHIFPVIEASNVVGILELKDVKQLSPELLDSTHVSDIMKRYDKQAAVKPDDDVIDALRAMQTSGITTIPVMEEDHIIGLLSDEQIVLYLEEQGLT